MRQRLPLIALVAISSLLMLAAVACGGDDDDDTTTATSTSTASGGEDGKVTISDNKFTPAEVNIAVNHEVIWTWSGSAPHSVSGTFAGEKVQSPTLTGTGTFAFSFTKAGTFSYQCGVHGASMSGKVTIK